MDKNTILAFALIALIFIGFTWLGKPSEEEIARTQQYNDSIASVERQRLASQEFNESLTPVASDTLTATSTSTDSATLTAKYSTFGVAAQGTETFHTLENELIKVVISSKGGRIYSAELKQYKTHNKQPLILFDNDESDMSFTFATIDNRVINTSELYFDIVDDAPAPTDKKDGQNLVMRLKTATDAFLDIVYTLPDNDYMLSFALKGTGLNQIVSPNTNTLDLHWAAKIRQQEHGRTFENRYAKLEYKFSGRDVQELGNTKNVQKNELAKIKWIAFKDQFFSSVLIADEWFSDSKLVNNMEDETSPYLKSYDVTTSIPFDITGAKPTNFRMFLGPNQYKIFSKYDRGLPTPDKLYLNRLIPLGWGFFLFQWVNRFFIIPVFNFLSQFIGNFGIIILILTLLVKTLLFPLTFKSYMSGAKMRVLKPELDEINAKIPADKPQERQKAMMSLYNKVGVSPMGGCLPMLIQMPVLVALFYFFPAAIELRQESFLWAKDLSSYDSILTLPFSIPFGYGNHVSLFCLLMTAATIMSTKLNQQTQPMSSNQPGMGMMKWMMYLMPVFFLFIFNGYASGLTFYYFVSTLISVITIYICRAMVDEKKVLAQLHAKRAQRAKNPVAAKKMTFMERLEAMQREQIKNTQKKRK
ncbi:MAG: membrane protein insertase YidC [Prevotellaceae bacterium]|jgi:YidC/Oxa1 family membrane protein insertase|nr:membrane protein insertase YidC [Prevotellaceae bacterium]